MLFSPDLFVTGGGVSKDWDKWGHLLKLKTPMVPAKLRNRAGIIGAALAAKDAVDNPDVLSMIPAVADANPADVADTDADE